MKKKSLLFLLLFALFAPWAAKAQTTVEIGDGTNATYYAPIGTLYNYSITEQLYTADEIGMAGTIQSISFNYALSEAKDFPIEVYMKAVDAANLSTAISLADADLVFDGTLSVTEAGWATITLDSPFVYDGTSNLLIGVNKGYVQWFSGSSWYYTEATDMTRYSQNDSNAYDASTTTPGTATAYRPNIQMEIVESSGPFCPKPASVAVNYTGGTTAEVSWNSDAASFNIDVNGTVTNGVTNPYTLTGLDLATTYTVKVQAVCGGDNGSSDWTNGTTFTTDMCMPENQCDLTFVVTDSYGDGWNGNAIVLTDVQTGVVLATIANQNLDGTTGEETQTVTLAVCDGRPIEFSWTTGSYIGETSYTVTDINNEVIVEGSGQGFETFTFTPNCTPVTCDRPLNVVVTYNGGTTAQVTWEAHAESYNIDLNGTVIEGITETEYELTGLDLGTTYNVMVQANCGTNGLSNWTNPVSFMTDLCLPEDMCAITFQFEDSYGDGWNGAAMQVYDYDKVSEELTLLGEYTIESGSSANYTLNVCDGRTLAFVWSSGNYDSECSYAVYDNLGDPILSGSGAMSNNVTFSMNCNSTCRTPANFAASEITGHEVTLSWTEQGEATEWTILYMAASDESPKEVVVTTNPYTLTDLEPTTTYYAVVIPTCEVQKQSDVINWTTLEACPAPVITVNPVLPNSATVNWTGYASDYEFEWAEVPAAESKDALWLQYDNGTYVGGIGNSTANTWTWGVMYPASMLEGNGQLSKVAIYENSTYNTEEITINIYSGGDDAPGTLVYTETVTPEAADAFHEITLAELVTVDPTQNLWITLTEYGTYVLSYCQNGDNANNDWVLSGSWAHIGDLASSLAGDTWMIRGYVEPGFDPDELDWQQVANATSPVILEPLEPETTYVVRIKALCGGEDGESHWTTVTFTTPDACATPVDLTAEAAATSANLSWTAYTESYNLRYRHTDAEASLPAIIILEAHDVWEDESGYQMLLDATHSLFGDVIPASGPLTASGTCDETPEDLYDQFTYTIPENADPSCDPEYFVFDGSVTIEIPAGTYDWCITNPSSGDRIWIAGEGDVPGRYDNYVFEPGVTYHFTMQRFGTGDGAALEIDRPLSDWITVENVTNPYTLTGLTPKTYYEWQVQGVNCSATSNTEWSEVADFFTTEETTVTQTIALATGWNFVSFNVEVTLDDLKAALVDAVPNTAIQIKGQNKSTTYNPNNHRWTGQLNSSAFDIANMYKISVTADCEITLEGMRVDPAEHPITIANGANWIAFPLSQNMTLTNAFAGFAIQGDQVLNQLSSSTYIRGRWQGQLSELESGMGYVYKSVANETKILLFPSASKTAPRTIVTGPYKAKKDPRTTDFFPTKK